MPSNIADITDKIDQQRWKAAVMDWLDDMRFHLAVTLVCNRRVGLDRARADFRNFVGRVDEALVGSHFYKLRKDKRVEAVFVVEGTVAAPELRFTRLLRPTPKTRFRPHCRRS